MKKIKFYLLFCFMMLILSKLVTAGEIKNQSTKLKEVPMNWEIPVATGFLYGSPEYYEFCNMFRNLKATGETLPPVIEAFLNAGDFENVDETTWIIIERDNLVAGKSGLQSDPNHGVKLYFKSQGQRLVEVGSDVGVYGVLMPVSYVLKKPTEELYFAIKSKSLKDSLKGDGLAIFETAKGTVLATLRVGSNVAEGDVVGTIKSVIQVPYSIFEFGGTVVVKTIRVPVDLVVGAIRGIIDLFSDEDDDEDKED